MADILRLRRCPSCGKVKAESDVSVKVVLNGELSVICHQCEVDLLATIGEKPTLQEIVRPFFPERPSTGNWKPDDVKIISLSESQVA